MSGGGCGCEDRKAQVKDGLRHKAVEGKMCYWDLKGPQIKL